MVAVEHAPLPQCAGRCGCCGEGWWTRDRRAHCGPSELRVTLVLVSCAVAPATADRRGAARGGVQNTSSTSIHAAPSVSHHQQLSSTTSPLSFGLNGYARCQRQLMPRAGGGSVVDEKHGEHSGHEAVAVFRGPLRPEGAAAGRGPATPAPAITRALTALTRATAPSLAPPRLNPRAPALL